MTVTERVQQAIAHQVEADMVPLDASLADIGLTEIDIVAACAELELDGLHVPDALLRPDATVREWIAAAMDAAAAPTP